METICSPAELGHRLDIFLLHSTAIFIYLACWPFFTIYFSSSPLFLLAQTEEKRVTQYQGDPIGRIFAQSGNCFSRAVFLSTEIAQNCLGSFSVYQFWHKKWIVIHLGRLFHNLIRSPCYSPSFDRRSWCGRPKSMNATIYLDLAGHNFQRKQKLRISVLLQGGTIAVRFRAREFFFWIKTFYLVSSRFNSWILHLSTHVKIRLMYLNELNHW
jgi:hypothetical protein